MAANAHFFVLDSIRHTWVSRMVSNESTLLPNGGGGGLIRQLHSLLKFALSLELLFDQGPLFGTGRLFGRLL